MSTTLKDLATLSTSLGSRCAALGWKLTRHPGGRFMLHKEAHSLHFLDRASLQAWLGSQP